MNPLLLYFMFLGGSDKDGKSLARQVVPATFKNEGQRLLFTALVAKQNIQRERQNIQREEQEDKDRQKLDWDVLKEIVEKDSIKDVGALKRKFPKLYEFVYDKLPPDAQKDIFPAAPAGSDSTRK